MPVYSNIEVKDRDLGAALKNFLKSLLESDAVDALLVPWHLPQDHHIMPTLITDPKSLDGADLLSPCFPLNGAKLASRLTKRPSGKKLGLVMRPCEIRAFVELVKLKQGSLDEVVIIGTDCLGAFTNADFEKFSANVPENSSQVFYEGMLNNKTEGFQGLEPAPACTACEHPIPENADIILGLYGTDPATGVAVEAATPKGETLFQTLGLKTGSQPPGRSQAIEALVSDRIRLRDEMFERVGEQTGSIEKLSRYLSGCVNCYNCRVACPVCYCKECVFVTDVFDHDPFQYLQWAGNRGKLKMPSDTDFFHLTRMAHIGLTCVGCGQCSNACPNDIPLMELFRSVAHRSQEAFNYQAGRRMDEPIPFSIFENKEYEDVVGLASNES
ncbi:Coenzyme F420 hydrogenase/dehydrogenase, beta subunit C-terminal domain [Desulfospira joergensenii]|uniref:Coenzyme F420 hydrogenase/dehydrogenase, beta subunit C-terminal domain n=1 Tax=Desulfospira joergensenii TaxID=53329 RepID=UPI0003B2E29A|nr:Coenzyme F420 hydrogenase/dehydrogenase, beta subunit C-terminal domain [Desulfospira joergensenii]